MPVRRALLTLRRALLRALARAGNAYIDGWLVEGASTSVMTRVYVECMNQHEEEEVTDASSDTATANESA